MKSQLQGWIWSDRRVPLVGNPQRLWLRSCGSWRDNHAHSWTPGSSGGADSHKPLTPLYQESAMRAAWWLRARRGSCYMNLQSHSMYERCGSIKATVDFQRHARQEEISGNSIQTPSESAVEGQGFESTN
ncbi:hypothetical protein PI125_g7852 [Phytophthora idaei]|nr:hypothetical protein PI125_g7852 [Phytophthora idaei]